MPRTTSSELAALVAAARHGLEEAEAALSHGDDCLVALVVLARAAKRADDAVFALLDAHAAGAVESVVHTHRGYVTLKQDKRRSR
jgi:hypothetical protein